MQYENLGKHIKYKRESIGKTLNSFCFENNIEPAVLSRIENLKQDIKMKVLIKIAKGFNETPSEFLSEFEKANSNAS